MIGVLGADHGLPNQCQVLLISLLVPDHVSGHAVHLPALGWLQNSRIESKGPKIRGKITLALS